MTRVLKDPRDAPPFLVRVAGLPAHTMDGFGSASCAAHLQRAGELGDQLSAARTALADAIHGLVPGATPELRRLLLAVKRDCFNTRSLRRHQRRPGWPALYEAVGPRVDRVLALEEATDSAQAAFRAEYQRTRAQELDSLGALQRHAGLLRGLALASPALVDNLHRLGRGVDAKKEADLEATLLRYISRAALKTSPFSTLTRLGFATMSTAVAGVALRASGAAWTEHSLLRFKRYIPDQDYAALVRAPQLRARLQVTLSNALWEVSPGRYCFVRPGGWSVREDQMRYQLPALVQTDLGGPLVAWLLRELPRQARTHAELTREIARALDQDDERVSAALDKLLEVGLLRLVPPWPTNELHLERRMLAYLRTLPDQGELAPVIDRLGHIVELELGYASATHPLRSVRDLDRGIDALWASTRQLGGIDSSVRRYRFPAGSLYEDVFVTAPSSGPWQEIAQISHQAASEAIRDSEPLARLARLFHPQLDVLLSLAALAGQRWPGRREVGALELIRESQALWRAYNDFWKTWRAAPASRRREMLFDPLGLDVLQELQRIRREVWSRVEEAMVHGDDESRLAPAALAAALDRVPAPFSSSHAPGVSACLMLQPADALGQRWVVNHLAEGTGRFSSRFTPVMPQALQRPYLESLSARGVIERGDQRVPLLDLLFSFGDTLNLHPLQTPGALELPDEWLGSARDRALGLNDLAIRFGGQRELPQLVDTTGQPYAPVHLGVADALFMPTMIRFLALFGPGELAHIELPRRARAQGETRTWPRLCTGRLILQRQRWAIPASTIAAAIRRAPRDDAFALIHAWRLAHGLPRRVFLSEPQQADLRGVAYKPQYLDFTSPGLVALLCRTIDRVSDAAVLSFEELLPAPENAPVDADGTRWIIELQIDAIALNRASAPAAQAR